MELFKVTESNSTIDKKEIYSYIDKTEYSNDIKELIRKIILGVLIPRGDNDINLDFDDLKIILDHGGIAFIGSGTYEGEDPATKALKLAIENSGLDLRLMDKVSGVLIHFEIHPDLPIMKIYEGMELINKNAHNQAEIIWGTTPEKTLPENYAKVTILFTGFNKEVYKNIVANNMGYEK